MQIIRRSSFSAKPWKNGGGITHEAIRVPASGERFRWRLSVAQIDASGPFSDFAGYLRTMVLLRGAGLRLSFDGAAPVDLVSVGDIAKFDGASKTDCRLLAGPCTDLNLMVAKSMRGVTSGIERVAAPRLLPASCDETRVIFAISGAVRLESATAPAVSLEPWDLAVLPLGFAATLLPTADQVSVPLVFLATLDDADEFTAPRSP